MSSLPVIVLASRSPRREALLKFAGVPFVAHPVAEEEVEYPGLPARTAAVNSKLKATAAGRIYPERVILAADTVVFLEELMGKPADLDEARRMLSLLSGRIHSVHTAVTVALPSRAWSGTRVAVSRVEMKNFGPETIEHYFRRVDPLDKAGGYAIQEEGEMLIRRIEGSLSNVIGLPLEALRGLCSFRPEASPLTPRLQAAAESCRLSWLAP